MVDKVQWYEPENNERTPLAPGLYCDGPTVSTDADPVARSSACCRALHEHDKADRQFDQETRERNERRNESVREATTRSSN